MSNEKMKEKNESGNQNLAACGPRCACGTSVSIGGRGRVVIGAVILAIAGMLVVRALVKNNGASTANAASTGFGSLPAVATPKAEEPKQAGVMDTLRELKSLSELNSVASDTVGVFVFLPGKDETVTRAPAAQLRSAAHTIEPQLRGGKIGIFTLKKESNDYELLAGRIAVPGVLAIVRGGGMSAISGDITETKLIQALVTASSAGGCGAGGCGPRGCN